MVRSSNREQQAADEGKKQGEFLVSWLNGIEVGTKDIEAAKAFYRQSFPYRLITSFLESERITWRLRGQTSANSLGLELERDIFWRGFLGYIRNHDPSGKRAVEADSIRLRDSDWQLRFDAVFTWGKNGRVAFELAPGNDHSRAILALARLLDLGNANRVRRCRACGRFFYAWPRIDRYECSARCKTGYWQRTPQGRAAKAKYQRDRRKRRREEDQKRGRTLTGKQLKVSKTILAGLGK